MARDWRCLGDRNLVIRQTRMLLIDICKGDIWCGSGKSSGSSSTNWRGRHGSVARRATETRGLRAEGEKRESHRSENPWRLRCHGRATVPNLRRSRNKLYLLLRVGLADFPHPSSLHSGVRRDVRRCPRRGAMRRLSMPRHGTQLGGRHKISMRKMRSAYCNLGVALATVLPPEGEAAHFYRTLILC